MGRECRTEARIHPLTILTVASDLQFAFLIPIPEAFLKQEK